MPQLPTTDLLISC